MKVKLTKISSTHNNLRTTEIIGECLSLPQVGECFAMSAPPIDPTACIRSVVTTPVIEVIENGEITTFKTKNSTYTVTVQDEA